MTAMEFFRRGRRVLAACLVLVLLPLSAALAMRVSPMVVEMESRGANAVARIEVQNINKGNLAFETRIFRMTFANDGSVVETPADDKFLVFPPQNVLPAGGRQVVRLQWVGAPDLAASESYYLSVNQLPVRLEPGTDDQVSAQVQIVYNMRALIVVAPPGATPKVAASAVKAITYVPPANQAASAGAGAEAGPGVEVTLRNTGRRHAMMSALKWRFEGIDPAGKPLRIDITPEELNRAIGTGYVPALGERIFRIPLVAPFGEGPIRLTFVR